MNLRLWNVKRVHEVLEAAPEFRPFPLTGSTDLRALKAGLPEGEIEALFAAAETDQSAPIPPLPASLYREFKHNGRREGYEDAQRARRGMLYRLTLAEWLEGQGRFLPALEDLAWARLEESNWAWPAHARDLDLSDQPTLDLAAAMSALDMAEMDYLIGERLSPSLRHRIRFEVERRATRPFMDRDDHGWLHTTPQKQINNWTAVCVAGVVGAALYLETDMQKLSRMVMRGLLCLADYLETFDGEGGSTEGPDYWTYGFGNYVVLAQLLHDRTGGAIDLLAGAFLRDIAQFPLRTMLGPGVWASFSDSDSNPIFHPGLLARLASRLDLPDLLGMGMRNDFRVEGINQFCWPLRQFAWPLPNATRSAQLVDHDWYDEMGWMMSRLNPADAHSLRLAAKAGHNDEMHNQNDIGSFMVVSGGKVVLTDPGRGRYSKSYFGPERYENIFASSRGHSVPMINGFEQAEGRRHRAVVLKHAHDGDSDQLEIDMTSAYPEEAGLASLRRSIALDRSEPHGRVLLADHYEFSAEGGLFQSVLVTTLTAEAENGVVRIGEADAGVAVRYDASALDVAFERHEKAEKQYLPAVDLTRVVFTPRNVGRAGSLALEISPLR